MPRFLNAFLVAFILFLVPMTASAQDLPMPGRGEVLELRRDDSRFQEGYRSFIFGPYVRGMPGLDDILERVNADLEGDERVTMEQLDNANPCLVIYHRDGIGNRHNGSCSTNPMGERVTYASFCEGDSNCVRWPMAGRVYRVPSRPRLTPGERAEEMVRRLDETTVTETVPAPAELGGWLTELSDNMGEEQPPTYDQVRNVIAAVGRTLVRAESVHADSDADEASAAEPVAASAATDMTFHEDEVPGTSEDTADPRPTSAESGATMTSSTPTGDATSWSTNPIILWLIIAGMSLALILLLFKDNIRRWYRPTALDDTQDPPAPAPALPALTGEQERDLRLLASIRKTWNGLWKKDEAQRPFNEREVFLFLQAADTNRVSLPMREQEIRDLEKKVAELTSKIDQLSVAKTALPIEDPRVKELEQKLASVRNDLVLAKSAKESAEASLFQERLTMQSRLTAKEAELANKEVERKKLAAEFDAFREKATELATRLHQEAMAGVQLGIETAVKVGDDSKPSLLQALERVEHVKEQFDVMVQGLYNELLLHIAPELALVPASSGPSLPIAPVARDSWSGPIDESVLELAAERTSHGSMIPGFGGMPALDASDSESVPPAPNASIPALESLKGESTHPGFVAPAPAPDSDNIAFRPSQHPIVPPKSKKELKREERMVKRGRKTTHSFERAPIAQAIEAHRDEQTAVIDPSALERKKLEARTGKTIAPGMTAAARDDSPIPGSLAPPPPPVVAPVVSDDPEPDPTEVGSKPASLSIFDDLPGSSGETGVTVKRAVGKD